MNSKQTNLPMRCQLPTRVFPVAPWTKALGEIVWPTHEVWAGSPATTWRRLPARANGVRTDAWGGSGFLTWVRKPAITMGRFDQRLFQGNTGKPHAFGKFVRKRRPRFGSRLLATNRTGREMATIIL
jgi:hypothetical protein